MKTINQKKSKEQRQQRGDHKIVVKEWQLNNDPAIHSR